MSNPQQEYVEALAAYREAMARLQEAKRHIPLSPKDRWKQRRREAREAERARYLANKPEHDEWMNKVTAKAMAVLHQKMDFIRDQEEYGKSLRIRLPVTYIFHPHNKRSPTGNDDE